MKFSSPFCQACKALMQQFKRHRHNPEFDDIVFAEITVNKKNMMRRRQQQNDEDDEFLNFVTTQLNVTRIPYIHFYSPTGGGITQHELVDSFACDVQDGCEWNLLKEKLTKFATTTMEDHHPPSPPASLQTTIKNRIFNFFSSNKEDDDLAP